MSNETIGGAPSLPFQVFMKGLEDVFGLDKSVTPFLMSMAEINNKPAEYFICMALEEFKIYLDQEPHFDVDLEDDDDDGLHKMLSKKVSH
jgi:hypothetical protein